MDLNYCPYPGLRPYTEEESVYFKGRDEQVVEISKLLETRRFLMVTGASGDGKSSLIFAGVMPFARAGLLKAQYNNWVLADFRPERSPLDNFSQSISQAINIDKERVDSEMQFGFSALLDLYKSSEFYEDFNTEKWKAASEEDKKKRKRKCANLLILVDQFEEFFTNSENYSKGNPSDEAQNVVNLLLETATLAQQHDIPIYIICTMRSDFIGQCASFRNLPEFIGHSHFFVPRLKRQEIRQVIEEPAQLSGMGIKSGLIEVLINSISEGFDQLPLLQHALHQIWRLSAEEGVDMDLIHLAKIGGLNKNILSKEDRQEYEKWFDQQPEYKKVYLNKSGLGNTLDLHANELYESASEKIKELKIDIDPDKTKIIIQKTFQCLTKIDDGRGVRNRMTVREILDVISDENITIEEFNHVINIFRRQGNTFISPFIFNEADEKLEENTILDITHESLIRNWDKLRTWAKAEDHSFQTYLDFRKQINRWRENDKRKGYLLPIGPLNHFQDWISKSTFNKFWIKKYEGESYDEEETKTFIKDTSQFLTKSKWKNIFGLILLKYGATRVLNITIIAVLTFISIFFYINNLQKSNENVLAEIEERSDKIYGSRHVERLNSAEYIALREIENKGDGIKLLKELDDSTGLETAFSLINILENDLVQQENSFRDKLYEFIEENALKNGELKYLNELVALNNLFLLRGIEGYTKSKRDEHIKIVYNRVMEEIENDSIHNYFNFLESVRYISFYRNAKGVDLEKITAKISPFENGKEFFKKHFEENQYLNVNAYNNARKLSHNGGYSAIGYLYAGSSLKLDLFKKCTDSLMKYSEKVYNNTSVYGGSIGFIEYMKLYAFYDDLPKELLEYFSNKTDVKTAQLISYIDEYAQNSCFNINTYSYRNESFWKRQYLDTKTILPYHELIYSFSQNIRKAMDKAELEDNKKQFFYASHAKNFAQIFNRINESDIAKSYLDTSFLLFEKLPEAYKNSVFKGLSDDMSGTQLEKVSSIFYLPNSLHINNSNNNYSKFNFYFPINDSTRIFSEALKNKDSITVEKSEYVKILNSVLYTKINNNENFLAVEANVEKTLNEINEIYQIAKKHKIPIDSVAFQAFLYVLTGKEWEKVNSEKLLDNSYINGNLHNETDGKLKLLEFIAVKRAQYEDINPYIESINKESIENQVYLKVANDLVERKQYEESIPYIAKIVKNIKSKKSYGSYFYKVLGELEGSKFQHLAMQEIKNVKTEVKNYALKFYFEGRLENNGYYDAYKFIPAHASFDTEMFLMNTILMEKLKKNISAEKQSQWDYFLNFKDFREFRTMYETNSGGGMVYFY